MIEISWQTEANTRASEMIVGFDRVAIALYHRLQDSLGAPQNGSTKHLPLERSVNLLLGKNFIAIKAKAALLPWVNGLSYLSPASQNSRLYLPTNLQPNVPIPWLEGALKDSLKTAHNYQRHDLLYWPETNTLIQADRYWSVALVKQTNLLTLWYEQHS